LDDFQQDPYPSSPMSVFSFFRCSNVFIFPSSPPLVAPRRPSHIILIGFCSSVNVSFSPLSPLSPHLDTSVGPPNDFFFAVELWLSQGRALFFPLWLGMNYRIFPSDQVPHQPPVVRTTLVVSTTALGKMFLPLSLVLSSPPQPGFKTPSDRDTFLPLPLLGSRPFVNFRL